MLFHTQRLRGKRASSDVGRRRRPSAIINTNSERDTSSNALLGRARESAVARTTGSFSPYIAPYACFHILDKIPSESTHVQPYDYLLHKAKNRSLFLLYSFCVLSLEVCFVDPHNPHCLASAKMLSPSSRTVRLKNLDMLKCNITYALLFCSDLQVSRFRNSHRKNVLVNAATLKLCKPLSITYLDFIY